jgi:hypothetical protein
VQICRRDLWNHPHGDILSVLKAYGAYTYSDKSDKVTSAPQPSDCLHCHGRARCRPPTLHGRMHTTMPRASTLPHGLLTRCILDRQWAIEYGLQPKLMQEMDSLAAQLAGIVKMYASTARHQPH